MGCASHSYCGNRPHTGIIIMDTLIQWLVTKWGWGALVLGILLYLLIEGGLDVVTDEISYRIQKRREKND